jgi:class 3 adenylate cyclase
MKFVFPSFKSIEGILSFKKGDYKEALNKFEESEYRSKETLGVPLYYERNFYLVLTLVKIFKETKNEKFRDSAEKNLKKMEKVSQNSPNYLYPKYLILKCALDSIQEKVDKFEWLSSFDKAITFAESSSLPFAAAVGSEFLLELLIENFIPMSICSIYFEKAQSQWNAVDAKLMVKQLKKKYPSLNPQNLQKYPIKTITENDEVRNLIKATQTVFLELRKESMVMKTLEILVEYIGCEKSLIFMNQHEDLYLLGACVNKQSYLMNKPASECENMFSSELMDYVQISKEFLILDSISENKSKAPFASENVDSVYIYPMMNGDKFFGAFYFQNSSNGFFDEQKIFMLEHIASQFIISNQNILFFEDLKKSYERFIPKEFLIHLGEEDITRIKKGDSVTKKVSILFTDIREFTKLAESDSEESFSLINEIFTHLTPLVSKNNGFIDKFLGDCIMAIFPHEADDAVKCGFDLIKSMKIYNSTKRINKSKIEIGIGIHYGTCRIGMIGDDNRLDATVISDIVNTASRVESFTKTLGVKFLVTLEVLNNLKNEFPYRSIGKYLLKGKDVPVEIFEMLSPNSTLDLNTFNEAMKCFNNKEFSKSRNLFLKLKDDVASLYLSHICEVCQERKLEDDWNGEIRIDKNGIPDEQ